MKLFLKFIARDWNFWRWLADTSTFWDKFWLYWNTMAVNHRLKIAHIWESIIFSGMTFATSDLNYDNYPWKQRMNVIFQKLPARKRQISFLPIKLAQNKNPFCFSEANKLKKQGMSSCKETSSKMKESHLFLSQISSRNNKFIVLSQFKVFLERVNPTFLTTK